MPTVNAATSADMGMRDVSVHRGLAAPSQRAGKIGGLVGAAGEDGHAQPLLAPVKNFSDLLAGYDDAKKTFETGFDAALDKAKNATSSLKSLDFSKARQEAPEAAEKKTGGVLAPKQEAAAKAPPPARGQDRAEAAAKREAKEKEQDEKEEREALEAVEEFVDQYNRASKFLAKNQEVSDHVASLASMFDDTSRSVGTLSAIGVTSDEDGTLRVDTDRLGASLRERPESVEYALGADGLAGRAEKSINLATFNRDKLFPSVSSVIDGGRDTAKAMYSGQASPARDDYGSRGAVFNLYY